MGLFDSIDISASALSAERLRMDVTAENLANAQTHARPERRPVPAQGGRSRRPGDGGFAGALASAVRRVAGRRGGDPGGVQVTGDRRGQTPTAGLRPVPPGRNAQGYVAMPNVNPVTEMVDLITASRSYEANVTAMQTAKQMFSKTLDLLR